MQVHDLGLVVNSLVLRATTSTFQKGHTQSLQSPQGMYLSTDQWWWKYSEKCLTLLVEPMSVKIRRKDEKAATAGRGQRSRGHRLPSLSILVPLSLPIKYKSKGKLLGLLKYNLT